MRYDILLMWWASWFLIIVGKSYACISTHRLGHMDICYHSCKFYNVVGDESLHRHNRYIVDGICLNFPLMLRRSLDIDIIYIFENHIIYKLDIYIFLKEILYDLAYWRWLFLSFNSKENFIKSNKWWMGVCEKQIFWLFVCVLLFSLSIAGMGKLISSVRCKFSNFGTLSIHANKRNRKEKEVFNIH